VLLRLVPAVAAAAALAVLLALGGPGSAAPEQALLMPDLDQETPSRIAVRGGRLGFASAVRNVGEGPLVVSARRGRLAEPLMAADQLVRRRGAPPEVVEDVGRLRYVRSRDHQHWHLLRFERYELREPGGGTLRGRDRKTGFCLGDRYRVRGLRLPRRPANPVYTSRCGLGATRRLGLTEGISVGYGDDYDPWLEGQSLPLRGLSAGRYVLVHRVNAGRRLRESDYANNAASVLLRLRRRGGEPRVRVIRRCPGAARCEAPGTASRTGSARGRD
jgi:hypothetical protein